MTSHRIVFLLWPLVLRSNALLLFCNMYTFTQSKYSHATNCSVLFFYVQNINFTNSVSVSTILTLCQMLYMYVLLQAIQEHRRTTKNPLYWTNRNICDWLKDIQLEVGSTESIHLTRDNYYISLTIIIML